MSEMVTVYQSSVAMLCLTLACFFYAWGGRSGKWKRRFVGSFVLACGLNLLFAWRGIWSPWFLATYPLLAIGFSIGYGADSLDKKLIRRLIYAFGILSSGLLVAWVLGGNAWFVLIPHVGVGLWSIWLGIKNPIEAAAEETFICALLNICLLMYPFIGGL